MSVIPADHFQVRMELCSPPSNLAPGVMGERETAFGSVVVFGSEALLNHHERGAVRVDSLPTEHHSAEFDLGVGL